MPTSLQTPAPDARLPAGLLRVDPIRPVRRADPFDHPDWLFEPKYDGIRAFLHATALGCQITPHRELQLDRFHELGDRIARVLGGREAILDGEVVALDRQGRPVFRDLLSGRGYLAVAAFDLLWLDGRDLRRLPLVDRKRHLAGLLPADTGPLYKVLTVDEYGRALFAATRRMDLEGIVAKRTRDAYDGSAVWYTIPNPGYSRGERRRDPFRSPGRSRRADDGAIA